LTRPERIATTERPPCRNDPPELKRTVDELQAFNEIGRTLTSTLEAKEVLQLIMQEVSEVLKPERWSLLLLDEARDELYFEVAVGPGADRIKAARIPVGEGIAGWVARAGQPVLLEDAHHDPRFSPRFEEATGLRTGGVLAVPLRSKGRVLGVVEMVNPQGGRVFTPDDLRTLSTLADYAAIAIENARAFERIRELTLIDDHTGLYNARHLYRSLEAEVARARRFGRTVSLLFLDLDRFKAVNDRHGHQVGSAVLKEVGEVLRHQLRAMDVPVRYGGDEFVVLLPEVTAPRAVGRWPRRAIETTFQCRARPRRSITASFGVATYPDDGATPEAPAFGPTRPCTGEGHHATASRRPSSPRRADGGAGDRRPPTRGRRWRATCPAGRPVHLHGGRSAAPSPGGPIWPRGARSRRTTSSRASA
jgi:diguanylate cyclase (GGDEF)-like protein